FSELLESPFWEALIRSLGVEGNFEVREELRTVALPLLHRQRSEAALLQPPSGSPVIALWGDGQGPGCPQCWTMTRRRLGSSVMMPSTPAPTRAQRSLRSLIVQTIKRRRACLGRVALTASRHRSSATRKSCHD